MSFDRVAADPSFRALKALWQDEIPFPIPAYERAYLSAPDWWGRLLDDHYLLWVPRFHIVIGPSGVEQLDLKVDKSGRPLEWQPDEWLLPAHESVKRVRGKKPRAPWRWLRIALAFRGGVDACGHADPVDHISSMEGFPAEQVVGAILRACRLASRHLDKALAERQRPDPTPVQPAMS